MRKFLFLFASLLTLYANSQNAYSDIKLDAKEDYKLAEPAVLKASNYLFTSKYDKEDLERLYAIEFVMRWISGTPDFTFELDEKFSKPFLQETDLLGLYMSALAKYAIEHKEQVKDSKKLSLNAVKMVIEYSNKSSNNLKQTGELKKNGVCSQKRGTGKIFWYISFCLVSISHIASRPRFYGALLIPPKDFFR